MNYNNGRNQLELLDLLNIASFVIGLMNLEENLTQGDKQQLMQEFNNRADLLLGQIHSHLKDQDKKLNSIIERLDKIENDDRRNLS